MSNIDKRALRHSAESIIGILENIAGFEPSDIDGDSVELRFETEDGFDTGCDVSIVDQCQKTADVVRAMLDELERNQQYIKSRDQENEEIALTVGKLRVEREEAKSKLNEQREYYEGVISDGGKRIAELEKQCAEWERKALSNFEECAAMAERIEEMQTKSAPDSFGIIGENIRTQDNRITSDPMFCVYQKREIVVDADYDHDRIVWVDEDGNEANKRHSRRLELLHENFREPPEKWRRVAVKDIDEFVTCCFTEQGCKDYLAVNGHNLRLPFIYVKSGFRNAEYIGIRNWLAGIRIKGE
ncbi:ead/Ea22-like family protein [Escherichia coli]